MSKQCQLRVAYKDDLFAFTKELCNNRRLIVVCSKRAVRELRHDNTDVFNVFVALFAIVGLLDFFVSRCFEALYEIVLKKLSRNQCRVILELLGIGQYVEAAGFLCPRTSFAGTFSHLGSGGPVELNQHVRQGCVVSNL